MKTFIIGYMLAGKTTYGRKLAGELGVSFHDLDEVIESQCGKTIPEIFREEGEEYFRQKEHEVLLSLCREESPCVIACGGGTPCHHDNLKLMKSFGSVVYYHTPLDTIVSRARLERKNRPLLSDIPDSKLRDFISRQLKEREEWYLQADLICDSQPINTVEK